MRKAAKIWRCVTFGILSYFEVEGGGGHFINRPSPPSCRAASRLLNSQGFVEAAKIAGAQSVLEGVEAMTRLHG